MKNSLTILVVLLMFLTMFLFIDAYKISINSEEIPQKCANNCHKSCEKISSSFLCLKCHNDICNGMAKELK